MGTSSNIYLLLYLPLDCPEEYIKDTEKFCAEKCVDASCLVLRDISAEVCAESCLNSPDCHSFIHNNIGKGRKCVLIENDHVHKNKSNVGERAEMSVRLVGSKTGKMCCRKRK